MATLDGSALVQHCSQHDLGVVIKKFEDFCTGETNETYERFIFNQRNQGSDSFDQYVSTFRKLARTYNFCGQGFF
jgi:hypothetical protein